MTSVRRTLELPYRAEDLFELAADVRRYPDFIKWIKRLDLTGERSDEAGWSARAEAVVGFLAFREAFVTDVSARRDVLSIEASLVRGPLRRLRTSWRFAPAEGGTRVDFGVDFVFKNPLLQAAAEANREAAVARLIEAFTAEAARRYEPIDASPGQPTA